MVLEPVVPEKKPIFPKVIEELIARQRAIIAACEGEISYCQGVMAQNEQKKKTAEETIVELEERWSTERKWVEWPMKEENPE